MVDFNIKREKMEYDLVIVGAGPAGLRAVFAVGAVLTGQTAKRGPDRQRRHQRWPQDVLSKTCTDFRPPTPNCATFPPPPPPAPP